MTVSKRHCFLSPHYDDVALSCGGTAALRAREGCKTEIVVLFGGAPEPSLALQPSAIEFHQSCGFDMLDAASVVAARRREEALASSALGVPSVSMPFYDAIYRLDDNRNHDSPGSASSPDEGDLLERLIRELHPWSHADRFYVPLAVGGHLDHRHAFDLGLRLAEAGADVWFYEDIPYALNPEALPKRLAEVALPLTIACEVDVTMTWSARLDAIYAYSSQLDLLFGDWGRSRIMVDSLLSAYAAHVCGKRAERFWQLGNRAGVNVEQGLLTPI